MYVIKNTDTNQFVAIVLGWHHQHSYTRDVEKIRVYKTREAAEADRCPDNEIVVVLEAVLSR